MDANFTPKTVDIFNINAFTLQEIILFIAYHLVRQNKAARDVEGFCRFKVGDMKCAVGFCIPDEKYEPKFENASQVTYFVNAVGIDVSSERLTVLLNFQAIHDQNRDTKLWKYLIIEQFSRYFDNPAELRAAINAGIAGRTK